LSNATASWPTGARPGSVGFGKTVEQRRPFERERDKLGKRLERWYERIDPIPSWAVGAERTAGLQELRSKQDEVIRSVADGCKNLRLVVPKTFRDSSAAAPPTAVYAKSARF
jgi:hypothetical protein